MTIIKRGPDDPPSKVGEAFSPFTEIKKQRIAAKEKPPVVEKPPVAHESSTFVQSVEFSLLRKRIIGAGVLLICIVSMGEAAYHHHGSPSLGWMVALSATWALSVWLWPFASWYRPWIKTWTIRCILIALFGNVLAFSLKFYERELDERQATKDARILADEVGNLQKRLQGAQTLLSYVRDAKDDKALLNEAKMIQTVLRDEIK